jgi:DNA topoisomerase I
MGAPKKAKYCASSFTQYKFYQSPKSTKIILILGNIKYGLVALHLEFEKVEHIMSKKLLIVESPAKAKTIEKYLGNEFFVKSSYGHIRDLDKGSDGIDIKNGFEPKYVVSPEKRKVVKDLLTAKEKASEVWLATDEDREGEAISWHLCEVLGLDPRFSKRIVFSEITKPAIQKAVSNPRTVDINLVKAQQARRLLDRLVGYELSEVLWRKVKGKLSAGRVQSVAVKLIVEKEREINAFETNPYFKVTSIFDVKSPTGGTVQLKAELKKRLNEIKDASDFVEKCVNAEFKIQDIEKKPLKRKPAAPFTTSTLQQEASRKLGFGVNRTMRVAQNLYEEGHITYMRTDSVNISNVALNDLAEEIKSVYGDKYLKIRQYKSKSSNAQEAHEAIRPTYPQKKNVSKDRDQQRLYELILKRTLASQMEEAEIEKTTVDIGISTIQDATLVAEGEVLVFDGFLAAYSESTDEDEEKETKGMLPPLSKGQVLALNIMEATERYTRPPARYTEASLVQKLEELGIGRPSTYAPTISKIMEEERGYVTKESRPGEEREFRVVTLKANKISNETKTEITGATSNRLYPSSIGMIVTDFLSEHFDQVMDYSFTAEVEERLDRIANGKYQWKEMLSNFYGPFHSLVEKTMDSAQRAKGRRELGKDPGTGRTVLTQITRFGPVVQIGEVDELAEGEKPLFANLQPGQSLETISFEEAMDLFKLPKSFGQYKGEELIVNNGRFGPYVKLGEVYANLPRTVDPLEITKEQAIVFMDEKLKENAPIAYYQEKPITKGKGRFGPFVKWNDLFVNVPKKYNFDHISESEAIELVVAKIEKEANRYIANWPEEKIAIENGRWGPFIRFGKSMVKIPKIDGEKATAENLADISLEQAKAWIEAELPGSFKEKAKKSKK